jgi:intracellular sulfur oxidation DsrE/DsrF family protein
MQFLRLARMVANALMPLVLSASAYAQQPLTPAQQRAEMFRKKEAKLIYPFVRGGITTGVLPVSSVDMAVDQSKTCKLVFDFSYGSPALYTEGKVNPGLEEICRILNLHSGAGIPDNKMDIVIILHGPATMTFLQETAYKERFGAANANLGLLHALQSKGVKFVVCGQTLQLRELDPKKLLPGTKVAFSARSAISMLVSQGYVLFPVTSLD